MEYKQIKLLVCLFLLPLISFSYNNSRIHENFDFDWKFYLNASIDASSVDYDDSKWEKIQLPHDWSIKSPIKEENGRAMGFLPGGIGWYRKSFTIPDTYNEKKVSILFEGVYHQSDVYLNGKHLGFHPYGYTAFEYDLTPYLNVGGENSLAVKVDHSGCPSSRWYSGSGIYRHVWLKVNNPVHIATWGTYITTPAISHENAEVKLETTVKNSSNKKENVEVQNRILDAQGKEICMISSYTSVEKETQVEVNQTMQVANPRLWSIDEAYLYTMETTLISEHTILDKYTTTFGIRSIQFDANKGFFLNGENIKLKGFCLHQDAGCLGTAVPDKSYLRRLKILKEYGVNAIRCSHNPPSSEFLDMCDSLGFVVIDEAFDKWKSGYYSKYFDDWWQQDMNAMIKRDRNHPSIILWSIGNETSEQDKTSEEGTERAVMLRDYVHSNEPSRLVTAALRPTMEKRYTTNGFTDALDVVGYNYQEQWLLDFKEKSPKQIMYISEAYPYYRGRNGTYKDFNPINPWYDVANNDFVFGQFLWAGIDYLGESTAWPSTGWATGLFDVCMFEKPSAAFHRSVWNAEPMVRIAVEDQALDIDPGKPHWSWPFLAAHWNFSEYVGHVIQVHTTSNCENVELWLNDKSFGRRNTSDYSNNTIVWNVPYQEGTIEAKGYINGKEVAEYELTTSGKAAKLILSSDRDQLAADGQDLAHLTIKLVDEQGNQVQDSDQVITVEVLGNGKLLGLDNGDLRRIESYKGNRIKTYFGKALAIVQSDRQQGEIKISVTCNVLPKTELIITNY